MKRAIAYILVCLFVSPLISKVVLVGNYLCDYHYYATVLCQNKEAPEMQCNGTCQLAKEIKQADQKEAPPEMPSQETFEPGFFQSISLKEELIVLSSQSGSWTFAKSIYAEPELDHHIPPPKG